MTETPVEAPTTRGRRDPSLAAEIARARSGAEDEYLGEVTRQDEPAESGYLEVSPEEELHDPTDEYDEPDVLAVIGDVVTVKISHSLPQANDQQSWYTAGMATHLEPGETPAEGLQRVTAIVRDHLVATVNDDWSVVADMQDQITTEIRERARSKRITPQ